MGYCSPALVPNTGTCPYERKWREDSVLGVINQSFFEEHQRLISEKRRKEKTQRHVMYPTGHREEGSGRDVFVTTLSFIEPGASGVSTHIKQDPTLHANCVRMLLRVSRSADTNDFFGPLTPRTRQAHSRVLPKVTDKPPVHTVFHFSPRSKKVPRTAPRDCVDATRSARAKHEHEQEEEEEEESSRAQLGRSSAGN